MRQRWRQQLFYGLILSMHLLLPLAGVTEQVDSLQKPPTISDARTLHCHRCKDLGTEVRNDCARTVAGKEVAGFICLRVLHHLVSESDRWTTAVRTRALVSLEESFGRRGCLESHLSTIALGIENYLLGTAFSAEIGMKNRSDQERTALLAPIQEILNGVLPPGAWSSERLDQLLSEHWSDAPLCPAVEVRADEEDADTDTDSTLTDGGKTDKSSYGASDSTPSSTQTVRTSQARACRGRPVGALCDPLTGATCTGADSCPTSLGVSLTARPPLIGAMCQNGAESESSTSPPSRVPGDSNHDGVFDSSDIVLAFTAGKYETGQSATFEEGDWDGDGRFTSADIVWVMQHGS